jgi:flagellar hook protein FlgE
MTSPGEGTSGKQIGLGVSVGKIAKDMSSGMLQETGVSSHMAVSGDGFFVLRDSTGMNTTYTRAGDFEYNYNSTSGMLNLLGPDGMYLYGSVGGARGTASDKIELPSDIQSMMMNESGVISYIDATGNLVEDAFVVDVATFPGESGLSQAGSNQFVETSSSGSPIFTSTEYSVVQGHLENSNVDLAQEFTEMIVAERGFQANSRTVTTSDSMLQELLNLKR